MIIRVLLVSLIVPLALVVLMLLIHRLIGKKVNEQKQYECARALAGCGIYTDSKQIRARMSVLFCEVLLILPMSFIRPAEMPYIVVYIMAIDDLVFSMYAALCLRVIDPENSRKIFWRELKRSILYDFVTQPVIIAILFVLAAIAGGEMLIIASTYAANVIIAFVVFLVAIWFILGGWGRLMQRVKSAIKKAFQSLQHKPLPNPA